MSVEREAMWTLPERRERAYTLTVKQVQALRQVQERYRAIADTPGIRESARQAACREIARIEGEIRG